MTDLNEIAAELDGAAHEARSTDQISSRYRALGLDEAYRVQALSIERRISRGERLIGVKMGFTSRAKMVQMGLSDLIWGRLTDAMRVEDGTTIGLKRYVHPRVEPEIAFILGSGLSGKVSIAEAAAAVAFVAPAMEIIDSRYENFKFDLGDVIADNASSSGFVLGPAMPMRGPIDNLGLVMSFDGQPVQIGSTASILGQPLRALAAASRLAGEAGLTLQPGWLVMAGGATAAEALRPHLQVRLEMENLGSVGFATGAAKS